MGLQKGSDSIENSVRAEQAARAAGRSDRVTYFSLKDQEHTYLRFLTEHSQWPRVDQHNFVATKSAPAGMKDSSKWPKGMSAVCRKDKHLVDEFPDGCYICTNKLVNTIRNEFAKPVSRVWALAIVREQIIGDGSEKLGGEAFHGKHVGFKDVSEEYAVLDDKGEVTDERRRRPKLVVVNMAWQNFFAALHNNKLMTGTVLDRDFMIRRVGSGTDTDYHIVAAEKIPDLVPGTEAWKRYDDLLVSRKVDLDQIIMDLCSDEHIAKWFDPTLEIDQDGKVVPAGTVKPKESSTSTSSAPADISDGDNPEIQRQLAALKNRVEGGVPAAATS